MGNGHCKPSCRSTFILFLPTLDWADFRFLAPPICEDGMGPIFNDSQSEPVHYHRVLIFILRVSGCQTFLIQVQRDENIRALLDAIYNAFDFTQEADALKDVAPHSKQGHILTLMLQHVCHRGDLIKSYAQDVQFCMSTSSVSMAIVKLLFVGKGYGGFFDS